MRDSKQPLQQPIMFHEGRGSRRQATTQHPKLTEQLRYDEWLIELTHTKEIIDKFEHKKHQANRGGWDTNDCFNISKGNNSCSNRLWRRRWDHSHTTVRTATSRSLPWKSRWAKTSWCRRSQEKTCSSNENMKHDEFHLFVTYSKTKMIIEVFYYL